jgi:hypothetical protein
MSLSLTACGSPADRVNAVAMGLRSCLDYRALEYRFPALARCLSQLAGRTGPGLAEAVAWLHEVIEAHPVLAEPRAAGIRHELRVLAGRITPARPEAPGA